MQCAIIRKFEEWLAGISSVCRWDIRFIVDHRIADVMLFELAIYFLLALFCRKSKLFRKLFGSIHFTFTIDTFI